VAHFADNFLGTTKEILHLLFPVLFCITGTVIEMLSLFLFSPLIYLNKILKPLPIASSRSPSVSTVAVRN
jgi:hypothetical protein